MSETRSEAATSDTEEEFEQEKVLFGEGDANLEPAVTPHADQKLQQTPQR